jgi:hypothetical protein
VLKLFRVSERYVVEESEDEKTQFEITNGRLQFPISTPKRLAVSWMTHR